MEVGQEVLALDLLADKTHLAVKRLVGVKISQANLENTSTETISGNLGSGGAVNQSLADLALKKNVSWPITAEITNLGEVRGSLDVVPLLARHGVRNLLLGTLLALSEPLRKN